MATQQSLLQPMPMRDLSNTRIVSIPRKRPREDAVPLALPIPLGFVALNNFPSELWSQEALQQVDVLDAEADKRNPDVQEIRAYEDFYALALYELIEAKFREFYELFKSKPASFKTWHVLEALTFFIATLDDSNIDGIDEYDRFCAFVRVFASAWYTVARHYQSAKPLSLLSPAYIPNASNVIMTAAKTLEFWCGVGGLKELEDLRDVPTLLSVMLRRDGWEAKPKTSRVLGEYGETPEDESDRPRKRFRTSTSDSTRVTHLARITIRKAHAELDVNDARLDFEKEWLKYEKEYAGVGFPLFEVGNEWASGFDITKWPTDVRAKLSLARELSLGGTEDDAFDFIARDARQHQWVHG